ncbi:MAG: hypothetical protein K2Y51_26165 [Gammaproteobacteria bacterium]|nr:hypothetical protein [Gammaproteobacteria bacterium]
MANTVLMRDYAPRHWRRQRPLLLEWLPEVLAWTFIAAACWLLYVGWQVLS